MSVLVTRPQPDNDATCTALNARGYAALSAPLLRFEAIPFHDDGEATYGAVIVTSANALRALAPQEALLALPLFAVGDHTADAAKQAGFKKVISADGDAAALRDLIAAKVRGRTLKKGSTLLYLAGADFARDLAGELGAIGFSVVTQTTYRMAAVPALPPQACDALAAGELQAVLHYSRRSARAFLEAARAGGVEIAALAVLHACISDSVGAILRDAGAGQIVTARAPDETSLFEALDRALAANARQAAR